MVGKRFLFSVVSGLLCTAGLGGCDNPAPAAQGGAVAAAQREAEPAAAGSGGAGNAAPARTGAGANTAAAGQRAMTPAGSSAAADGGAGQSAAAGKGAAGAGGSASRVVDARIERAMVDYDSTPDIDAQAYEKLLKQLNAFGMELGRRHIAAELAEKNAIFSPLSATIALGMTYAGAGSRTAEEMNTVLAEGTPPETFHAGLNQLMRALASRVMDTTTSPEFPQRIELSFADALYVDDSLNVAAPFLEELSRNYDSGVYRENFVSDPVLARMNINDWVASKTHDRILDLLPSDAVTSATRFVLVNALYFYGSWKNIFEAEDTHDADFHALDGSTVSVPTMLQTAGSGYADGDGYTLVDVPYAGDHLSMVIVMPDDGKFAAIRDAVTPAWLDTAVEDAAPKTLDLSLPKFELTSDSLDLREPLIAMGMTSAFSESADFSGITTDGQLVIKKVIQKAFVGIDETGTEAAAATAVVGGFLAPPESLPVAIDRPFLFFIRDLNGMVLFSGQIVNPEAS
jgi:serpin B